GRPRRLAPLGRGRARHVPRQGGAHPGQQLPVMSDERGMKRRRGRAGPAWGLLAFLGLAGGGQAPAPPVDTGARKVVESDYEGLLRRDGDGAYVFLPPESRARLAPTQFARLAAEYHRAVGFEAEAVRVRSCEEHGTEAIAHVLLTGRGARPSPRRG